MRVTQPMIERGADVAQRALDISMPEARGLVKEILHAAHREPLETDDDRQMPGQTSFIGWEKPVAPPDPTTRPRGLLPVRDVRSEGGHRATGRLPLPDATLHDHG